MKMKQEKMRKIGIASALGLVVLVMLGLYGASNYKLNYSLNHPTAEKTGVGVRGYQVRSEGMLHIADLYNHDMGYNVLLPDLYGHGESEGDHIQMGWKDRLDVIRWSEMANEIFRVKGEV